MDGSSYNYGFRAPHTNSPLSPDTPTSASYKTNVKRTKTKKWVEAKTQNYDGDDWGNDFEDEADDPVPVPPLKPTGYRQAGQSTNTALPSHQPPAPSAPQPAEPVPSMRPAQPTVNEVRPTSSHRPTAGLPPLQIQNSAKPTPPVVQQPVVNDVKPPAPVAEPASVGAAPERAPQEPLVSPPPPASAGLPSRMSPAPIPAPVPAPFAGRPEYPRGTPSPPVGSRRTSPAPAQTQTTRFPPRKSSMGQQDRDRQASGSRSSSTQRPWIDQRSASPSNVKSPGTPSNTTAAHFIRPSDIYRRMDDNKEKEGGLTESGRPSMDSATGPRSESSVSAANSTIPVVDAGEQQPMRRSLDKGDGLGVVDNATRQPILAPVAERKSEYGFDGLLAQPQAQGVDRGRLSPPGGMQESNLGVPEPQLQRPTAEESDQNRRYSTSPRLPDLARMSLFGDDFFSNPDKYAHEAPPMPSLPSQIQTQPSESASTAEKAPAVDKPPTAATPGDVTSPLPTISTTPQPTDSSLPASQPVSRERSRSPSQTPPALEESSRSRLPSQTTRPSIPGGWVTETRSVADSQSTSAVATPAATADRKPILGVDPGEVSPITDNEDDKFGHSGIATVKDTVSIPVSIPEASERAAQMESRVDQGADLETSAPLHPRESGSSSLDFAAPERLQRESTMSTIPDPSPVKESDKLREEIMRSLSPVRPTSHELNNFNNHQSLSPAVDNSGTRESAYLDSVYDDYWTAGDDKPDVPSLPSQQPEQKRALTPNKDISDVPPLSPRKDAKDKPPALGRRFSWEAGGEQVTPKASDAQKDPLAEPHSQPGDAGEDSVPPKQGDDELQATQSEVASDSGRTPLATGLDDGHISVPQDAGVMSHQVSQVSSAPRDRMDSEVIEPPSPVSVTADKNTTSAAPTRRLSLAEEKSMARVSSNPVSPSPPPGDHPALAQVQPEPEPEPESESSEAGQAPASPAAPQRQSTQPVKITTFKEIMDLSNAKDRIQKYNETRSQFASMDSGLNNWLENLKAQHPEHANATASFGVGAPGPGQSQSSPTTSQPASQQPYYQQYLNASNPNLAAGASGRPPAGSAPTGSSHSPSSDFKHSSGQVGAKGKGLLLAAGKAGKGLLSKGKNKLRGTGDKSDSSPPPAQSKTRAERRTSWGISLGSRSSPRADSYGHAHSRSHSGSVSGPTPQTIPEHPASPTPPPQLPQTSRTSPFDTLTQGSDDQASAWAPPRPHTPPQQSAGPPGDSDSEPVSPVSDTHSISTTPRFQAKDTPDDDYSVGGDLQVPRPISKTQPSWDPFTGTPLVEEEGFEMGQSTDPSPPASHAGQGPAPPPSSQAIQTVAAVRPRANTADEPYDDWVVVSPQSPPSGQIHVVSPQSPPQAPRSFEPTESSREVGEDDHDLTHGSSSTGLFIVQPTQQLQPIQQQSAQQQPTQQPQQQQQQTINHLPSQQTSPQRQSSFVGLPPIRRSSTFGINLTKRAKKRFPLDEDDDNNFVSSPVNTTTDQYGNDGGSSSRFQQGESSWSAQSAQPMRVDTGPPRFRKDSNMSHNVLSATSTQAATLATESSGMTGQDLRIDDEKRPLGPGVAMKGAGRVPGPIDTRAAMQQNEGRTSGPPYGPGMPPHQGIMSPTFGGNPIHHLPPQGPWKLEESHLSEPLAASRNRQSGGSLSPHQQTSFGIDKETGVPSTAAQRPETQLPPRQKFSEVPPSSAQRYPGLFTPQAGYQNPSSPTGPRGSEDIGQHFYNRDSASLYRTQTGDSEVSGFDPSIDEERGRKRSSGFFKEIGGRISRHTSRERPASKAESGAPSYMAGPDVRGDAVSEASVATGELQDRQRRRSSFFLNLRGSKPSDVGGPQGRDGGEGISPSPKASPNPGGPSQVQQPPPGGPAERKRSFFGPGADQSANLPMPNLSRSSTSTAGYEVAGGAMGPPKKRFSGFTSKVFPRSSSQQDLQVPQKPSTSHSTTTPTMFGRPPSTQGSQPGKPSPLAAQGRERSNTTGTNQLFAQETLVNKPLGNVEDDIRGRRSSAGGFFSGLFGKRAANKTTETQHGLPQGQDQNASVPAQFRVQQHTSQQLPPSNLGPRREDEGQPPIRSPPQGFGQQQQQESPRFQGYSMHPEAGARIQSQPQSQPQGSELHQRKSNGSFLPSPQPSQQFAAVTDQQRSPALEEARARPVSDLQSERREALIALGHEVHDEHVSRRKSSQMLNMESHPSQSFDAPAPPSQREQPSPGRRRLTEQRQPSLSFLQAEEQLSRPEPSDDQTETHWVPPGFSAEPTPEPSIRHSYGRENSPGPQTPPLGQGQGPNHQQALGVQKSGHARRISEQSASLLSPSSNFRAQSPNGVVGQSDTSLQSSKSNSPKPAAVTQMPALRAPLASESRAPPQDPSQGHSQPGGPANIQEPDGMSPQMAGVASPGRPQQQQQQQQPQLSQHSHQHQHEHEHQYQHQQHPHQPQHQHQGFDAENRPPAQFSQAFPPPNQRSSLPFHHSQDMQSGGQDSSVDGQQNPVSKWFKNRTSTQPQPRPNQGPQKESTTKSLFSAFKRSSKQPEPRPQQQMPHPSQVQNMQPQPQLQQSHKSQGQQRMPPAVPLSQRSHLPQQGPHHMYQEQRPSMGSFEQGPPPQRDVAGRTPEVMQQSNGRISSQHDVPFEPVMTRAIPNGPGPSGSVRSNPQPYVEPQYDQVPIPRGYDAVHGEGGVAPSPYALSRTSPPVQYPAYHSPQVPQWDQPPVAQRYPSEMSMYSHPSPPIQQGQQLLHSHSQGGTWPEGDRRVSMASHQSNISHASHSTQAVHVGPQGDVPIPNQQHQPQQDSRGIRLVNQNDSRIAGPDSQFGQQIMPPSQQPQQQRYSLVDAPAPVAASPQMRQSNSREAQGKQQTNSAEGQTHASNVVRSAHDKPPSPHPQEHAQQTQGLAIDAGSIMGTNSRSVSDDKQRPAENIISSEPSVPAPASAPTAPRLSVNVQQANQEPKDNNDLYESTPRLPSNPSQPPAAAQPIVAANTGHSMVSDSSADEAPRNASHANGSASAGAAAASTTLARGKSTRAELEDTEDERQRTMRREAQEEKILVDPYEELSSGGVKYRKEEEPADVPQMSATSYPGQEWNPYGAGGYEDWD
ncbi:hypothetical protein CNYM01_07059 [Colletotrichum nymphaeae SA-01]|uniref:SWI-SNF chromatin-remodeling complex protein n=1 Tax=Colletotrichum nymphaeae SA-01 TaxID=1460502 RepID=A0A135T8Q9_9PEZI|nr:hypothetical protein CNYM01_07059 [Colletotrichum nymphaeae SA-01]